MSTRRKLWQETCISRDTPARIRGLAVFAECLAVGIACGDRRRRTRIGSALQALRDMRYTNTAILYEGLSAIDEFLVGNCERDDLLSRVSYT